MSNADAATPLLAADDKTVKSVRIPSKTPDAVTIIGSGAHTEEEILHAIDKDLQNVASTLDKTIAAVHESQSYDTALLSMVSLQKELFAQINYLKKQKSRADERKEIKEAHEELVHLGLTDDQSGEMDTEDFDLFWTKPKILTAMFIIYLVLSNMWFMWRYNWHLIDSMFVVVIIFTSVGYGIEIDDTDVDRFMVIVITIFGVFMVATGIGITFVEMAEEYADKQNRFLTTGEPDDDRQSNAFTDAETVHTLLDDEEKGCIERMGHNIYAAMSTDCAQISMWLLFVGLGGYAIGWCEGWKWFESIYFIVMSGTTVGFGDYAPETFWGKFWIIFYLPLIVASTAYAAGAFFSDIMYSLIDDNKVEMKRLKESMGDLLNTSNYHTNMLLMDIDGDGKIDENEFMLQILVNEYDVPEQVIQKIKSQFKKLDDDGSGYIDEEDFKRYQQEMDAQKKTPISYKRDASNRSAHLKSRGKL